MNFISKNRSKFLFICICLLITRLWHMSQSLEFYSDMGRDHFVMIHAVKSHKPPLLGPSNSVLPLNQSPIYYYLNFPVFILSGLSEYTTIVTLTLLYLVAFGIGFFLFRRDQKSLSSVWMILLFATFHPQFIAQSRYAWNPTFTVPFLLVMVFCVLRDDVLKKTKIWLFALCSAIAVGCSYSVAPTVLVLILYLFWTKRAHLRESIVPFFTSYFIVFLPLILVDLRTHFLISKRLFIEFHTMGGVANYGEKIKLLAGYLVGAQIHQVLTVALICVLSVVGIRYSQQGKTYSILFLLAAIVTLLSPFPMASHYIFGVAILFFVMIATLHPFMRSVLFVCLFLLWLPTNRTLYLFTPHRSVAQLQACAQQICREQKEPLYVSEQAWHSYHYSPDWLFELSKAGCEVTDITQTPGFATRMAVVEDNSSYTYGKTSFNELTLFGRSKLETTYVCDGNIRVFVQSQTP